MDLKHMLASVRNDCVEFVTLRPPNSRFMTLERRVVVTGPPELAALSVTGDLEVLDELVELLKEPDRAWAAEVLLAAMTRLEEKTVDGFAAVPEEWVDSIGKTAHERWRLWLGKCREKLTWDSANKVFTEFE